MIETMWPYLAIMLLAAGLFPSLERRYRWRFFSILPPIVLTYLFVTALAVGGVWSPTGEVQTAQRTLTTYILPTLLFLLMVTCDLRAIMKVGPRVLAVFACAMGSILLAITIVYVLFRGVLPQDGWKMLAALSATWTGGSANLVAVKQTIGLPENLLPPVLLADALVYSLWVLLLLSSGSFAPRFNRWTRAESRPYPELTAPTTEPADAGGILLWLGIALFVALGAGLLATSLPTSMMLTTTSWTVIIATVVGLIIARTPLARIPGPAPLAGALLAILVAVLGSQSNFGGMASAPLFVLCGVLALVIHVVLFALAARTFRFDLQLTSISSLAQIGGIASASVLAATYTPTLVPVAVMLALLGIIMGTGIGLLMSSLLSVLAP
jgi:uncharacterized membrane protein